MTGHVIFRKTKWRPPPGFAIGLVLGDTCWLIAVANNE
jgi:hypothetical protein